jgi:hypothetical protein
MKNLNTILLMAIFALMVSQPTTVKAQTEDCYMPVRPPTLEDKRNFIEQISNAAVAAEKKHGVPASAIAGMALLESGYGLTRLSVDANNIFGYKKVGGQPVYKLACQPSWDVGNEYVKFKDWAEAIDFVAGRLAISQHYSADTAKYQADIAAGVDRKTAAISWLKGIASPYNYEPKSYVAKVEKCINDPYVWSAKVNEQSNLWKLNATAIPVNTPPADDSAKLSQVRNVFSKLIASGGRYMEQNCTVLTESGNSARLNEILNPYFNIIRERNLDLQIRDCTYQQKLKGRVIMLNVGPDQLAKWAMSSCLPNITDVCLSAVIHNIWLANNAQFPITGTVAEEVVSKADCTQKNKGVPALYAFRDGVTVRIKSFRPNDIKGATCNTKQPSEIELRSVLTEPIISPANMIRIANFSREKTTPGEYLNFARNTYLEALGKDEYPFLKAWVTKTIKTHQFTRLKKVPLGKINSGCWYAASGEIDKKCK